ncbi:MAG TPA: hypothetical protein VII69_05235 [Candidatus Eremiobacteraceae bacterium]
MNDDTKIDKAVKDAKDAVHEADHRVKAGTEHVKREIAGDTMNPAEKATSALKEAGHNVAADVDKAKRELRDQDKK